MKNFLLLVVTIGALLILKNELIDKKSSESSGLNATTTVAVKSAVPVAHVNTSPQLKNNSVTPAEVVAVPYVAEDVVTGLTIPWSIVFTSPERMLIAERTGVIKIFENGKLNPTPLHVFKEVSQKGEEGLMSLTLHPQYAANKLLYASLAYEKQGKLFVKVVRMKDVGSSLADEKVIIDGIPAAQYHAGSRLAFGPDDGKLYITTGDATERALAQKMDSLAGKLLRLNDDGTIPMDNPFPGSPIWSYGHRNSQGLAWHPITGELYSTEHGPTVFDGPAGGDEINRIIKGGNYGWPLVSHENKREGTVAPLEIYTPAEAPASAMFYTGNIFPQFKNHLMFGALKGEGILSVLFNDKNPDLVQSSEKIAGIKFGRIRAMTQGLDGYIYFSTSNKDGRGSPRTGDDRIMRLVPKK